MDHELLHTVTRCADMAARHGCNEKCRRRQHHPGWNSRLFAEGTPPAGYWGKLRAFAARHGYNLVRGDEPRRLGGEGCNGMTVQAGAPFREYLENGVEPFTVYIREGLTPATEFLVICHELTHVLLPCREGQIRRLSNGHLEASTSEIQAHLSAMAVARLAGLKIRQSAICYVAEKLRYFKQTAGDREKYGALLAARQIAAAL